MKKVKSTKVKTKAAKAPEVKKTKVSMDELRNPHANQPVKNPIRHAGK